MDWGYRMSRLSKACPDKLLRIAAHHDEFGYMLWKMERGKGSSMNNKFKITDPDNRPETGNLDGLNSIIQNSNSQYTQSYSTNLLW